ncbi:hypothetical protein REX01_000691 [Klebsiella aerogenes]|nr:hypothetical protein [Klebsiella aerogenes]
MNVGHESQNTDSLYDFLYVDSDRASNLITQLYAPGVMTSIKRISTEGEKSLKGGGFDVKIAKGNVSVEDAITHTQEKLFDASWALPINLLDKLSELDLINIGIDRQKLGKIVLIRGKISFFDISFFSKSMPFISRVLTASSQPQKKKINPENLEISEGLTFGMMKDLLDIIPNTLQVDFIDNQGNNIWMTIDRENFTINPDDMALKYGGGIPGEWFVLGLVDALPNYMYNDDGDLELPLNPIKDGLKEMLSGIQEMAGRSSSAYGMTPIILFRKIV